MRKIISIIFLAALLSGCAAGGPYSEWKALKFTTPPDKTDQDREKAQTECIKYVSENTDATGATLLFGVMGHFSVKGKAYQKCMEEKGYPCIDDLYECPYKPEKK